MRYQFSQKILDILSYSKEEYIRLNNRAIEPEHLLLGLLRDGESKAIAVLQRFQVDLKELKRLLEYVLQSDAAVNGEERSHAISADEEMAISGAADKILKMCMLEARLFKASEADSEHLLLAILKEEDNKAAEVLKRFDIQYDKVYNLLQAKPINPYDGMGFAEDDDEEGHDELPLSNRARTEGMASSKQANRKDTNDTPVLDNFSIDMTRAAMEATLDPVVGREMEIERLAQILSRRKKNNPVLIGEPGVGKSAIVEGLALRIVQKKVSRILFDKRVALLDMTAVVAGTKYRGQFEERMRAIIGELQKNKNIILFIDEIHTLVGAGAASGSMDAANMLKPALARGEIQCIGATTLDEYRKSIEKDGALERRFQKIIVEPTTPEETLQILHNIKDKYEEHHNVTYSDAALEACVKYTARYITDRHFPDKAIDALDEAGSRMHITNISVPKKLEQQERKIEEAQRQKTLAVGQDNFELAASYRDLESELTTQLEVMKSEWIEQEKMQRQEVNEETIAKVVSMMSGVPVQRMVTEESVRLAGMKAELQQKVVAQDDAIDKVVRAILRSRVGLKDPNHPIGTFMFLGPTGVGKTYLAKQLAKHMFGSADALIRIDMSEYMEKYAVSRMVGAAPGYIGYEEGGQLTEKVRRKPYSIVLFDEIEKAHPDVFNILLQVLDEGRLTDGSGRTVDFKNTVIIMTSNIGTRQLKEFGRGVGFTAQNSTHDKEYQRSVVRKALNKTFSPEFLNRLDEIITFDQLSLDAIVQIVDIELQKLILRIEELGYMMTVSEEAKRLLAQKGYDVQFGARPLHRAIQTYLEDVVSEKIVSGEIQPGDCIQVEMNPEKDGLSIHRQESLPQPPVLL